MLSRVLRGIILLPFVLVAAVFCVLIVVSLALEDCFSNWRR